MVQRENPSHLSLRTPNAGHFSEQVVSKTRVFINMVETVSPNCPPARAQLLLAFFAAVSPVGGREAFVRTLRRNGK